MSFVISESRAKLSPQQELEQFPKRLEQEFFRVFNREAIRLAKDLGCPACQYSMLCECGMGVGHFMGALGWDGLPDDDLMPGRYLALIIQAVEARGDALRLKAAGGGS